MAFLLSSDDGGDVEPAETVQQFQRQYDAYRAYLTSIRDALPTSAYEFATHGTDLSRRSVLHAQDGDRPVIVDTDNDMLITGNRRRIGWRRLRQCSWQADRVLWNHYHKDNDQHEQYVDQRSDIDLGFVT